MIFETKESKEESKGNETDYLFDLQEADMHSDNRQLTDIITLKGYQGVMKDEDKLQDILSDDKAYHLT